MRISTLLWLKRLFSRSPINRYWISGATKGGLSAFLWTSRLLNTVVLLYESWNFTSICFWVASIECSKFNAILNSSIYLRSSSKLWSRLDSNLLRDRRLDISWYRVSFKVKRFCVFCDAMFGTDFLGWSSGITAEGLLGVMTVYGLCSLWNDFPIKYDFDFINSEVVTLVMISSIWFIRTLASCQFRSLH